MEVIVLAWISAALIVGLLIHRWMVRKSRSLDAPTDAEGLSITDIASVIPTMSVLLLAFIMVATFDSWSTARDTAAAEANSTIALVHTARFLPHESGAELARDMQCYTRSVQHIEWNAMADREASNVPEYWEDTATQEIQDARKAGSTDVALQLLGIDRDRTSEREVRLTQSKPSVPLPMTLLMVFSVALSVFFLGMLTHASIRRPLQLATLLGATALLTGALLLIGEMDTPYSGPTKVKPTSMHHASEEITEELAEYSTRIPPPCDAHGLPSSDGSFHAKREPIE